MEKPELKRFPKHMKLLREPLFVRYFVLFIRIIGTMIQFVRCFRLVLAAQ